MMNLPNSTVECVLKNLGLESLTPPVDIESLAHQLGIHKVERCQLKVSGVLVSTKNGPTILLNEKDSWNRQRFSCAHELAHFLFGKSGMVPVTGAKARLKQTQDSKRTEENACDKLASEILMPRPTFYQDGESLGWSLKSLSTLENRYQVSPEAVALRLQNLMPEPAVIAVWRIDATPPGLPKFQWSFPRTGRFIAPYRAQRHHLWLINRAAATDSVYEGVGTILDRNAKATTPKNIPAEALGWGKDPYRKIMVFYFPERSLSPQMVGITKAFRYSR